MNTNGEQQSKLRLWLKRIGMAGFLFFLIKGLIWIVIFIAIWLGLMNK
ncbi:MAG TPA: hypothetical protein PLW44_02180 [Chitinophagales bacterium]|nr:hypothetical protein [Chitinophagales bacterium]